LAVGVIKSGGDDDGQGPFERQGRLMTLLHARR
jgi:hypothetical protein